MERSLLAVVFGTFTLRFSTGLTGALIGYYLADLADLPVEQLGWQITPLVVGASSALFYLAELVLSPLFGILSDRWGHHRVMQLGPIFGGVAVVLTALTTNIFLLGGTRILEGASTAASIPSILGYLAMATAFDERMKGRQVARFEAATLAGLGVGIATAGIFYQVLGPTAFLVNAGIYGLSLLIYRFGVAEPTPTEAAAARSESHFGLARYGQLLRTSHVWLLAPTWIAVNASIGLWFSQSIFQFAREDPRFPEQALLRGFSTLQITAAALVIFGVFGVGLFFWGRRFAQMRRTTIIGYGILGGGGLVAAALVINHSLGLPVVVPILFAALAGLGLFVLAGATPAALGLLTDISDGYPTDRGAIMGLYSVFLAIGQIGGSIIGGLAAELRGVDGLLVATLVLLAVALVPLYRLRSYEHYVDGPQTAAVLYPDEGPAD